MTYFGFLGLFMCIPIALFLVLNIVLPSNGRFRTFAPWMAIALHVFIAVVYTTPWDNYLVASKVWWYNPELVTGIIIGYVPIEEYTFFILLPIMTGLFLLLLMRKMKLPAVSEPVSEKRAIPVLILAAVWLFSIWLLFLGPEKGNYLGLELIWALPPIMLQLSFGADILWKYRKLVFTAIATPTLYLSWADSLAIGWGTWTISPTQSFHEILIPFINLPVEEFLFFLITNVLVVLGMTLMLADESQVRLGRFFGKK